MALLFTPLVAQSQVGISGWQSIKPAVSERYADHSALNGTESAQALSSPTLAESTTVWFGGRQWVIIGWNGEGIAATLGEATLLLAKDSPHRPGSTQFFPDWTDPNANHYTSSALHTAINDFYTTGLTEPREKGVILPRTLTGGSGNFSHTSASATDVTSFNAAAGSAGATTYRTGYYIQASNTFDSYAYHALRTNGDIGAVAYTGTYHPDHVAGSTLNSEPIWPLSFAEAGMLHGSVREYNGAWWLRSPGHLDREAALADVVGRVYDGGDLVYLQAAPRPAFKTNLTSVIFTSLAGTDGKSATVGNTLTPATPPVGAGVTGAVKFTLMDAYDTVNNPTGLALTVSNTSQRTVPSGGTVEIAYTNATTGTNNYVSAVIVDNNGGANQGKILFYGKLASAATAANGTASFTVPALANGYNGYYTIKLFVEEANGDNATDFASMPISIEMVVVLSADANGIVYVDETKSGDGSSWDNAYPNLAYPLLVAAMQQSFGAVGKIRAIYVAQGTYYPMYDARNYNFADRNFPDTNGGRYNAFVLVPGVKIYGGFVPASLPSPTSLPSFGETGRNGVTILSGDIDKDGVLNNGNAVHVIIGVGTTNNPIDGNTVIDGVTISGGNGGGGSFSSPSLSITVNGSDISRGNGGGMFNDNSSPVLTHVTISGNSAIDGINLGSGGGMYNTNSSPVLTNVTISGNNAGLYGGGMFNGNNSSPVLTNVTISGNSAHFTNSTTGAPSGSGGGMYNANSSPVLTNVTISGNSAVSGGGMHNFTFSFGGMENLTSSPVLTNVTISGNSASGTNSITGTSTGSGGGMYNADSSPVLTHVTISGNSANDGGGMFNSWNNNSPKIRNSIIYGNTAEASGNNVLNDNGGNPGNPGNPEYAYSLIEGSGGSGVATWVAGFGTDGGNNIDSDPLFFDWQDPATATMPNTGGDYRLKAGSPAINAGNNGFFASGENPDLSHITTDLDGNPRFVGSADMGAYEYAAPVITSQDNTGVNFGDGGMFQVTADGNPAPTFSLSGAPEGVSINSATGLITIDASTDAGVHTFTITASNGIGTAATQNFTLTVSSPPTTSNVNANASTPRVGAPLNGTYTYTAGAGNGQGAESGTTFQWYRSTANTWDATAVAITGATTADYTPTGADIGKYLYFAVTPSNGTMTGDEAQSAASGIVGLEVSLNVSNPAGTAGAATIQLNSGTAGTTPAVVTATTDVITVAATLNDATDISWSVSTGGGTFTDATSLTPGYALPMLAALTAPVTITATFAHNTPPTATVTITNPANPRVGAPLNGTYTYVNGTGDGAGTESGTTFQWYRGDNATWTTANPQAITGATATNYTPTGADIGKYLYFAVTPSNGTLTGVAARDVTSGVVGLAVSLTIVQNGTSGTATIGGGTSPVIVTTTTSPTLAATLGDAAGITWTVSTGGGTFTDAAAANPGYLLPTLDATVAAPITVTATFVPMTTISSVDITVTAPVAGETLDTAVTCGTDFTCGAVKWSLSGAAVAGRSLGNTQYTATVTLMANDDYTFTGLAAANAMINGNDATQLEVSADGTTATLSLLFSPTGMLMSGSTASIPMLNPAMLVLMALMLGGMAARQRRKV